MSSDHRKCGTSVLKLSDVGHLIINQMTHCANALCLVAILASHRRGWHFVLPECRHTRSTSKKIV